MSQNLLPALQGLAYNNTREPMFTTHVSKRADGREIRYGYKTSPSYEFELHFEFLLDTPDKQQLKTLAAFLMQVAGNWDSFLYKDPDDYLASNQQFGVGDGVTTQFQLTRTLGTFTEPVYNVIITSMAPSITYSVNNRGVVTFSSAPANGVNLYWSGQYYYVCRFKDDGLDFEKFMNQFWNLKKCSFVGALTDRFGGSACAIR